MHAKESMHINTFWVRNVPKFRKPCVPVSCSNRIFSCKSAIGKIILDLLQINGLVLCNLMFFRL